MLVSETEGEFQGDVLRWADEIIRQDHLPFDGMSQEPSMRVGRGPRFPDLVLWRDRPSRSVFCNFELRTPDYSPTDADLVAGAGQKADSLGSDYFVTWNVNRLVLWDRSEYRVPLLQRRRRTWSVADIRSITDMREPRTQQAVRLSLRDLLHTLSDLAAEKVTGDQVFVRMPPDQTFVEIIHNQIHAFAFYFAAAIAERAQGSRDFRHELVCWFAEQGLSADLTPEGYAKAARQAAHVLLSRVVFYQALRVHYPKDLPELLVQRGGPEAVRTRLHECFRRALRIDYEPVFTEALTDTIPFTERVADQLRSFVREMDRWEYQELHYDILGRVFERLVPYEERHYLGQYFTRSDLVDLVIGLTVRDAEGPFLDPACGTGTFLVRLYSRLRHLAPHLTHEEMLRRLWGFDVARFPAHLATVNLYLRDPKLPAFPRVQRRDFFDTRCRETECRFPVDPRNPRGLYEVVRVPEFSVVVGNPPYTSYRDVEDIGGTKGSPYKSRLLSALRKDFGKGGFTLTTHAGLYTHFLMHSTDFLQGKGRIGFVTSNAWLDVGYGKHLQSFLLDRFKIQMIAESRCERWFEDAAVNTVIVVVERCDDAEDRNANEVRFLSLKRPLGELVPATGSADDGPRWRGIDSLTSKMLSVGAEYDGPDMALRCVPQSALLEEGLTHGSYEGGKWGKYLRAPDVYFEVLRRAGSRLTPLASVAEARYGVLTGANDFFYVKDVTDRVVGTEAALALPDAPSRSLRIVEAGDRSCHLLERKFLRPALLRVGDIDRPAIRSGTMRRLLVVLPPDRRELRGTHAQAYVGWGEEQGYHRATACAARDPWYCIAPRPPAPLLMPNMQKRRPVLGINRAGVINDHTLYGIHPVSGSHDILAASLFWTWHLLSRELLGRVQFGEGVLKTDGVDIAKFPVLVERGLRPEHRERIVGAMSAVSSRAIKLIWDDVACADRQELDDAMLQALGFDDSRDRRRVLAEVYSALGTLTTERMDKPKTAKAARASSARLDVKALARRIIEDELAPDDRMEFPSAFLREGVPTTVREFASVEGTIGRDLFSHSVLMVGGVQVACQSAAEANYVLYALRSGVASVPVPESPKELSRVVVAYRKYARDLREKLSRIVPNHVPNAKTARNVTTAVLDELRVPEELR